MTIEDNIAQNQSEASKSSKNDAAKGSAEAASESKADTKESKSANAGRTEERRSDERRGSGSNNSNKISLDDIVAGLVSAGRTMSPKLKELLTGTVALRVVDRSRAFLFGAEQAAEFNAKESVGADARNLKGDCIIELNEASLVRIWRGDLNPQIAMLSDKVSISGKSEMAVYFFNLAGR